MDGGNDTVVEAWTLEGCFLENVEYGEMDYQESGFQTINLTIRYDNATQAAVNISPCGGNNVARRAAKILGAARLRKRQAGGWWSIALVQQTESENAVSGVAA